MHWSGLLPIAVAATLTVPGSIPLGHASDGKKTGTLLMGGSVRGRAPFREAQAHLGIEVPDTVGGDGEETSEGEGMQAIVTLAERSSRAAYVSTMPVSCHLQAVVGTAYEKTARVSLRFADGSRTSLRLRRAPKGWHYRGHMIGQFVRTTSRIVAVEAYDARGRRAPGAKLQKDSACA